MWHFVGCLSPSRGPGLCSGVPEEPTVKRGWELTVDVITPGEMVDLVGGGEAVGRRRERERDDDDDDDDDEYLQQPYNQL